VEAAPVALVDSVRAFGGAVEAFVSNLAAVSLGLLLLGVLLHGLYLALRSRAWFNTLRAAYPGERFRWRRIWGAQMVALGINSVIPARAGDPARLYLAKQAVPNSTYSTVGASFVVEAVFDSIVGAFVLAFAISQGVLPDLPDLSRLPAFDLAFFARHPDFALFCLTALGVGAGVAIAVLSTRVKAFWTRVRQGVVILRDRRRYLREVASLQAVAWFVRFASFWVLLAAFGIPASVGTVLLVTAVFGLANFVPFTPQGAGAQQALLGVVLAGVAAGGALAAYSVGQQLSLAAFNVAQGFLALVLVFGTRDWRSIVRRGREERAHEAAVTDELAGEGGPGR
jgi:uncharacterized membrane protein YbhN (UPF0104 family)